MTFFASKMKQNPKDFKYDILVTHQYIVFEIDIFD